MLKLYQEACYLHIIAEMVRGTLLFGETLDSGRKLPAIGDKGIVVLRCIYICIGLPGKKIMKVTTQLKQCILSHECDALY